MAETGRSIFSLAVLMRSVEPRESAARPNWSRPAARVVEVAKLIGCGLGANPATRAASEAESGWPVDRAGAEWAVWVHLGHRAWKASSSVDSRQLPLQLDRIGSEGGRAWVSSLALQDRCAAGQLSAAMRDSMGLQPPAMCVTRWWQSTVARDRDEIG